MTYGERINKLVEELEQEGIGMAEFILSQALVRVCGARDIARVEIDGKAALTLALEREREAALPRFVVQHNRFGWKFCVVDRESGFCDCRSSVCSTDSLQLAEAEAARRNAV